MSKEKIKDTREQTAINRRQQIKKEVRKKDSETIKKIFADKVFFTHRTRKDGNTLHLVPKKYLEEILKGKRNVSLESRMCRALHKKENRCRKFDSCKKCIIDYWDKKGGLTKEKMV